VVCFIREALQGHDLVKGSVMSSVDAYRRRAAELRAIAKRDSNRPVARDLEGLARAYLRLAEEADRNSATDTAYETPPMTGRPSQ